MSYGSLTEITVTAVLSTVLDSFNEQYKLIEKIMTF